MPQLPEPLERLIQELSRLPGIGPKTAQRLAFHLLRTDSQRAASLAHAITLRPAATKFYRAGPVYEDIMQPGSNLTAEWEPSTETFRKCRINGRFVTAAVYRLHRYPKSMR